jgi:exosortase
LTVPGVIWRATPRTTRAWSLIVLVGLIVAASWPSLRTLVRFSFEHEHYSHIVLVPAVSAFLLLVGRRAIFTHVATAWRPGLPLLAVGVVLYGMGQGGGLSLSILGVVVAWVGSFVLCYGVRALRAGLFAVLFPLLMVPMPDVVLAQAISLVQRGSAEVSYLGFELLGVPVLRDGFVFTLPGITIEVARECSGIRSSMALLIVSLLAGHFSLKSAWTKVALLLIALPLLVVKNGIRIVTLTLLAVYVDPGFLSGSLHRDGGVLFFLLALAILGGAVRLLQRAERTHRLPPDPAALVAADRRSPELTTRS